ncbi:MAG: hypothetical protein AB1567_02255 [bacterium]
MHINLGVNSTPCQDVTLVRLVRLLPPELDVVKPILSDYTFSGSEPEGNYEVGGRLACPITLDYFSTDIETFTFTP